MVQLKAFEGIDPQAHQTIMDKYFKRKTYKANEAIIKKGKLGDSMFILLDGTAKAKVSEKISLALKAGDVFGEVCLIDSGKRGGSVFAETTAILAELNRNDFNLFVKEHPQDASLFLINITRILIGRLRKTLEKVIEGEMDLKQMETLINYAYRIYDSNT